MDILSVRLIFLLRSTAYGLVPENHADERLIYISYSELHFVGLDLMPINHTDMR